MINNYFLMKFLKVGYIRKPHGLKGEVKVLPLTGNSKRFKKLKNIYLLIGNEYKNEAVQSVKITPDSVIIKFNGYDRIEDVEQFRNVYLYVDRKDGVKLEKGEYYTQDLIGCNFYFNDEKIGTVMNIMNNGTCDIFIVDHFGKEVLYPFLNDYVDGVDIKNRMIKINQYEGFFD